MLRVRSLSRGETRDIQPSVESEDEGVEPVAIHKSASTKQEGIIAHRLLGGDVGDRESTSFRFLIGFGNRERRFRRKLDHDLPAKRL